MWSAFTFWPIGIALPVGGIYFSSPVDQAIGLVFAQLLMSGTSVLQVTAFRPKSDRKGLKNSTTAPGTNNSKSSASNTTPV